MTACYALPFILKMMNREQINKERASKKAKIKKLQDELIELYKADCLLCDDKQWYTEEEEEHVISKRPKKVEKHLVGRVRWKELFYDESYPGDASKGVEIERSKAVKVDGEWI